MLLMAVCKLFVVVVANCLQNVTQQTDVLVSDDVSEILELSSVHRIY